MINAERETIRTALIYTFAAIINVIVFYLLQVAAVFIAFALYGSGATFSQNSDKVGHAFFFVNLGLIGILFFKRVLIRNTVLLIISMIVVLGLYLFTFFYLPAVQTY